MNKKFAQFALPMLAFAFVSTAQAADPMVVNFGSSGSSFFATDVYEVSYIDSALSEYDNSGYNSFANAAGFAGTQWLAINRRESSPTAFSSAAGQLFDLNSMWLAGAWGSQTLTITGFVGGVEVYSTTVDITTMAQEFSFTGFQGIDSFTIATGTNFVKDPLTSRNGLNWALGSVNVTTVTAVPEPEAYAMLLAGLGLVGAMARRRQRR